jgi:hypothetical protein
VKEEDNIAEMSFVMLAPRRKAAIAHSKEKP